MDKQQKNIHRCSLCKGSIIVDTGKTMSCGKYFDLYIYQCMDCGLLIYTLNKITNTNTFREKVVEKIKLGDDNG